MPKAKPCIQVYDISTDSMREATQEDFDAYAVGTRCYGRLRTLLLQVLDEEKSKTRVGAKTYMLNKIEIALEKADVLRLEWLEEKRKRESDKAK